jgi:hypothetical protein
MKSAKLTKKELQAVNDLKQLLNGDTLKTTKSDPNKTGISSKGDLTLQFKNRKYSISVSRNQAIPDSKFEKLKDGNDIVIFRKNRKPWKVYLDLNTLILLLLNNRS